MGSADVSTVTRFKKNWRFNDTRMAFKRRSKGGQSGLVANREIGFFLVRR
jgi:hypothetical protein